jgi:hypothetical protein
LDTPLAGLGVRRWLHCSLRALLGQAGCRKMDFIATRRRLLSSTSQLGRSGSRTKAPFPLVDVESFVMGS